MAVLLFSKRTYCTPWLDPMATTFFHGVLALLTGTAPLQLVPDAGHCLSLPIIDGQRGGGDYRNSALTSANTSALTSACRAACCMDPVTSRLLA